MKKIIIPTAMLTAVAIIVTSLIIFAKSPKISEPSVQAETALEELMRRGIVEGFEDGELHPEYKLTRAQFAKMLNSTYPDMITTSMLYNFNDLDKNHWAFNDIQRICNAGWMKGHDDRTFRPDENITYEQAITIICRAAFSVSDNADYPESYIKTAMENSLTDGINALIGEEINREQAARMILNLLDYNERETLSDLYNGNSYRGNMKNAVSGSGAVLGGGSASFSTTADFASMESMALYDFDSMIVNWTTDNEEYTLSDENVFKNTVTSPLSTFSIDADTASYSNLRRFILNGQDIPNGSVRSEELINYFDYGDAEIPENSPFGVKYTVAECPWNSENQLAMITVSGEELTEYKPSNLVFLIDTSGSMYNHNKLPLVKQALSMLLDNLNENDRISIVTYASGTGVALESTPASEKEKILSVINELNAGGATAGASGINLAYEQAEKFRIDGNNRIILCTDGDFNVGVSSSGELEELITEKREKGIFLSVLGFGMGNYKDSKMEILADKGNGNYAYIDNLREAKKVLADEMAKTIYTIAKDVKIQTEFNPAKVKSYRLIGYENRILNNEDFENDKKDAGELGAGATVTVLYEIVPETGTPESGLKYQSSNVIGSDELMTVKIRYKLPDGDTSILREYPISSEINANPCEDFWFASAVAELGMILNNSEFKGNSTYESVINLARRGIGEDRFGLRCEFIQLVDLLRM